MLQESSVSLHVLTEAQSGSEDMRDPAYGVCDLTTSWRQPLRPEDNEERKALSEADEDNSSDHNDRLLLVALAASWQQIAHFTAAYCALHGRMIIARASKAAVSTRRGEHNLEGPRLGPQYLPDE